ncbi:MAG: hypothetical protein RL322_1890 [Pseudomonadota bacterium]
MIVATTCPDANPANARNYCESLRKQPRRRTEHRSHQATAPCAKDPHEWAERNVKKPCRLKRSKAGQRVLSRPRQFDKILRYPPSQKTASTPYPVAASPHAATTPGTRSVSRREVWAWQSPLVSVAPGTTMVWDLAQPDIKIPPTLASRATRKLLRRRVVVRVLPDGGIGIKWRPLASPAPGRRQRLPQAPVAAIGSTAALRTPLPHRTRSTGPSPPTPLSNCLIRHTYKMLIRLGVCVCYRVTVREGFERTESNTESNCALFGHMPGERWHTQNGPLSRMPRVSRK